MTESARKVFNGYLNLNTQEKNELIKEINAYIEKPRAQQLEKAEEVRRLGPTSNYSCPCCGK